MALEFNLIETFGLSIAVLLLGRVLVSKIKFLNQFCIPAPVVGGIIFALVNLAGYASGAFTIKLDTTLQSFFMICFFTTIGFGASWAILKKGSVGVIIFLAIATVLCVFQNAIGIGIAYLFGQNPLLGIATGSVPMTGGHATSAAFGPVLEKAGLTAGNTIAVAAATFGLVSGSLIGGPTANRLIKKYKLTATNSKAAGDIDEVLGEKDVTPLSSKFLSNGFFQIAIAVGLGSYVSKGLDFIGLKPAPAYIGSMLVAALMRNIFKDGSKMEIRIKEIQALGDIFLAVFLAQALMNLKLWELASLALPLVAILMAQVIVMYLYATYVTYRLMGKDYDAAVLSAGHCGFGLGATPNGVANMNAVVTKYFPSTKAFFILPIVGGLFIDFCNIFVITVFMNFFK